MIDFYNAFISYRHAPLDMEIAERIQHKLEHFHVPHNLRKKLKHKKITRIFRDKEELPITSNLTDTITDALEKAEYLIVICSTSTKESEWVRREIKTFLKTHSRDKILTVLCDGEPYDVIPEELLFHEQEVTDENGVTHTVKVPLEPLSCDYRIPRRAADREELPRLASALLGCSYDELQRRRRQYRIRRAAAIAGIGFAALAAFGFYMVHVNRKINESYIDSLRSKSVYLANESKQLFNEGKRADAIQIALAALPDGTNDKMPVTAEAVRAITDATYAYKMRSGISFDSLWNFKMGNRIDKYLVSQDGSYLAARDILGNVICWNVETKEIAFQRSAEVDMTDFLFMDDNKLLVVYNDRLEAYNLKNGKQIWTYDDFVAFLNEDAVVVSDKNLFFESDGGEITKLSIKDGSEIVKYKFDDRITTGVYNIKVTPDGKKLAFLDYGSMESMDGVDIYDTETGKLTNLPISVYEIVAMEFADNENLLIATNEDYINRSVEYSKDMVLIDTTDIQVYCYDLSLNEKWKNEFSFQDTNRASGFLMLPSLDAAMYYAGKQAVVYDIESGETISKYEATSSLVNVNDNDGNGIPMLICKSGEVLYPTDGSDSSALMFDMLPEDLESAVVRNGAFLYQRGTTDIFYYDLYYQDDEWVPIGDDDITVGSALQNWYEDDEYIIIVAPVDSGEGLILTTIDPNTGDVLDSSVFENENYYYRIDITRVDDKAYVILDSEVFCYDLESFKFKRTEISVNGNSAVFADDKVFSAETKNDVLTLTITDLKTEKEQKIEMDDFDGFLSQPPIYLKELNKALVPVENRLFVADLDSDEFEKVKVPENWRPSYVCANVSEKGDYVFISDGNTILVTDESFEERYTINCNGMSPLGATFMGDTMLVAARGFLLAYNAENGDFIGQYDLSYISTSIEIPKFIFDDQNHTMYIQIYDMICVFDTEAWKETAVLYNCYCYHESSDRFYTFSYTYTSACAPGYFQRYTLEDLIEKAHKILGNREMPEEYKSKYGL